MSFVKSVVRFCAYGLSLAAAALAVGCGSSADKGAEKKDPAASTIKAADPATEIEAALAKLSPEDRAAAKKQKVCPVTDEPLGSMGTPVKVTVKDRAVFLCCDSCEDELKADPDKYLAKLDAAK